MPAALEQSGLQPALIRGLYGYDIEKIGWEQPHAFIYHGRRRVDGLPILIKLLRDPGSTDWGHWLQRDYQIAQGLGASCAVRPFAFEQTDWGPALVYAKQEAQPLEELAAKAPLDIETVLTVGASIAEAVAVLHKERLIHCNLNPTTVWLTDDGSAALISDFACARYLSEDTAQGVPPCDELIEWYMSPEQTGRVGNIVDQRTDIYSLGIILFRLLTGKVPFDDTDPLHIIDGHVARQPTFPAELRGTLPAGLCKVILKALAKDPEARYLSANGLVADLIECRSQWRSTGAVDAFEPGHHDARARLRISRQLYGRERQTATLLEKAKSAQSVRPTMLLVKGAPGVGKSVLLGQLETFVHKENGRFVAGKFDQYKRNVPYLALIQALQQLIGQLLGGRKDELEAWRSRILSAVGSNAQVVIDVIPELELITGPRPAVPALPPVQARNRFNHVFTKLIQAFAPRDQLLCLVMDDLQWVDAASLALLTHVLTDADTSYILFAGAYRDNEVGPTHPLEVTINALKQAEVDVQILCLGELKEPDVVQLVCDTFSATRAQARELSQILHAKSGGNALYLSQFLPYLCDEGLIEFDYRSGQWGWDLLRIQQAGVTQDVLDLLNRRLEALQEDTRTILATAACIGSSFELENVAVASARSPSEVRQCLTIGVREGLIVGLEARQARSGTDPPSYHRPASQFRFLHDRIQQAAFDCIPGDAKKKFRLRIGQRLLAGLVPDDELAPPLHVLSNLNYAWELIADDDERQRVARLNLVAGRRARQALAYQDALGYISIGLILVGHEAWQHSYEVAFELHSEALECEYLTGNFERSDNLFQSLIANSKSKLDRARTYRSKILLDTSEERYTHVIELGIEALRLFSVSYARRPSRLHLLIQLLIFRLRMRGRNPQVLLNETELNDAEKLAALRILVALFPTAYFLSPYLFMYNGLKIVNYSLRHGISPISAVGFANLGFVLTHALNDLKAGYEFGRISLELAERTKDSSIVCPVIYGIAGMIKPWRDPIDEVFPLFDRVRKLALEGGENQYVNYAIISGMNVRLSRGSSLRELLRDCEEHGPFILASKDAFSAEPLMMTKNFVFALRGRTRAPYSLSDSAYDEEAAELRYRESGNLTALATQYVMRTLLACLFCRYTDAFSLSEKAEAVIRSATGFPQFADHYLYRGLAAAVALTEPTLSSTRYRRILRHCRGRLDGFARNCPHNFLQHKMLLEAEVARVKNDFAAALKYYNRAIKFAEAEGYTHLVGIANERAALCCLANDERRLALWYLGCARTAYENWGATAKVAWLDREYADLFPAAVSASNEDAHSTRSRSIRHQGESFDIAAALQASRIIASGENTEGVLTHLMQVIRVQAGAETAHLLVLEGGHLRLEASATVDSGGVVLFPSLSADADQGAFSPAIVNYVLHAREDLVLTEAGADARFAQCNYVVARQPKSVLCSPIRHQGELLGVIYLEHTKLAGAFAGQKLEWLRLLATEVGLAVWSARLSRYRDYVHKFAPAAVAKEIDANPASPDLETKDCDVSILFGDLAGYTRMTEQMERRQLDALMNRVFSKFVDEIHRYEGTLLEIRGDELFVLFADDDHAKHAWKAVAAARAISRAAADLKEELSGVQLPVIVNMGINSGVASVGLKAVEAASGSRWRYGASGAVVNIAARVRELARDGAVLLSAEAAARVQGEFALEDIGEHALKNVMNPIRVYRLLGEQAE